MRQRVLRGFTFRDPSGRLDWRVFETVNRAQSGAAFESDRPYGHIDMPKDWHRAYKQGFRIVPVTLKSGATRSAWKEAAPRAD